VAFAFRPTAVEATPVAAAVLQLAVVMLPVAPDAHCAEAGDAPNTVTIPAAIASPRNAPPASALAPMRRARRLSGVLTASSTTAT